jgi:hypothetical protein
MEEFKSWRSYWYFEDAVKRQARYIRDSEAEAFLNAVAETATKRAQAIPAQSSLWRAQCGNDWRQGDEYMPNEELPYTPERMKPCQDRASEGRANPKGIPYLYLATCRQTALAEMRAGKGSLISVGLFKARRDLRIVNCMTDDKTYIYLDHEPPAGERERSVWTAIDKAFATPLTPSDDVAEYVPTQILAELFKIHGFDGVAYRSSLGPGHNIALFDLEAAELIDRCSLFKVKDVCYEFESVGS